ncbi:MAG TPA: SRPBCC family protein [Bryobacteraceae bacterium]|jgi:uncharacterized protein YndB with AHSA1/START domain
MRNASIEIQAAPKTIFEYMTDPKHLKSWQPDVVEPRPLPPGGLQVGAHVGATVEEYGRRFDVDLCVAAMTRNQHIAYKMEAPTVSGLVEYRLVQWGEHTRVVSRVMMQPKGFLRRVGPLLQGLLQGMMNRMAQRKMRSRLQLLRNALENHA